MKEGRQHRPIRQHAPLSLTHGSIISFFRVSCDIHSIPASTEPILGLSGGKVILPIVPGVATILATCGDPSDTLTPDTESPVGCRDALPGAGVDDEAVGGTTRRRLRGFGGFSGPQPHWASASGSEIKHRVQDYHCPETRWALASIRTTHLPLAILAPRAHWALLVAFDTPSATGETAVTAAL